MPDVGMVWIALAALAGAIVSALMGWLDSKERFAGRKFLKSVAAGFIAAAGLALAFNGSVVGTRDLLLAFLSGAGVDAVGNRVMGSLRK